MKKKVLTVLLAAVVLTMPGCSSDSKSGSDQTAKDITIEMEQETESDGKTGEEADEQEAGEMQAAADAIDKVHAEREEASSDTSVEPEDWDGKKLVLAQTDSWVCKSSAADDNGGFAETYQCDDRLEYSWSCASGEAEDAQTQTDTYIDGKGWTGTSVTENEELTEKLGLTTCEYTAYEDDEGYSMLHRGVLVMDGETYYTADFSMMEGDMGEYEPSVQEWISQIEIG